MRILLLLLLAIPLLAQEPLDQLLEKIPEQSRYDTPDRPEAQALWDAIWKGQPDSITGLVDRLDQLGPGADFRPLYALHGLVIYLPPGEQRAKLVTALGATLEGSYKSTTKALVLRELWIARGRDAIPDIAKHLLDPALCEYASQALFSFGGEDAARELRKAAAGAEGKVRLTLLRGLGELRDKPSVPSLLDALKSDNRELRIVAADALAEIGAPAAIPPLLAASKSQSRYERGLMRGACIRLAQRLPTAQGETLLHQLWEQADLPLQCAIITELAKLGSDDAIRRVTEACASDNERMRRTAARAAARMPGLEASWFKTLADSDEARAVFVAEIAFIRSPAAPAILTAALADSAKSVRETALKSIAHTHSPELAKALIALVIDGNRDASSALRRLQPAPAVDSALAKALADADTAAKSRILDLLRDRVAYSQRDAVLAQLDTDAKPAAIKALGTLGTDSDAKLLISYVTQDESVRNNAADALALLLKRSSDQGPLLAQITAGAKNASGGERAALIRTVGRVAAPSSLATITAALTDADSAVVDAAVRSLADWPTDAAIEPLIPLAKNTESTTHNVLAIRGIVRLIGNTLKQRGESESLALYKQVNEIARRPDERKSVLGAIKRIRHIDSLALAEAALADEALRRDAESTCLDLANHLVNRDENRAQCLALLKRIADSSEHENHKKRADEIISKNSKD